MLRGCRSITLALAGLLLLTGAQLPAKPAEGDKSAQLDQTKPVGVRQLPQMSHRRPRPDPYSNACYNSNVPEDAGLCANWRSAMAAETSAREAKRATDWAIFGVLLSFATVTGLIVTIWQTNGALGEARRSNIIAQRANARASKQALASAEQSRNAIDAMLEANRITQLSVRPWIKIVSLKVDQLEIIGDEAEFLVSATFKNVGRSPAEILGIHDIEVMACRYPHNPYWAQEHLAKILDRKWYSGDESKSIVFHDEEWSHNIQKRTKIIEEKIFPVGLVTPEPKGWETFRDKYIALLGVSIRYSYVGGAGHTKIIAHVQSNGGLLKRNGKIMVYGTRISNKWKIVE